MPFKKIDHEKPRSRPCNHPSHDPPSMIVLPAGEHEWECPACHHTQVVTVREKGRLAATGATS